MKTKKEILDEFDELLIPPKFTPDLEGKDCFVCGHPMPNSRGTELLKSFLSKSLDEVVEGEREKIIEIINDKVMEQDASGAVLEKMADEFQVPISVMAIRFLEMHMEDVCTLINERKL